ncbi:MAG: hypothetical protein ACJAT7_001051 [Psychromonas sp.]|jgi:hypothetical protein|uniref:hypothetical protein n=1 Tax=Psychromonas sp. TaxID=1884585 RepID=UPI0039E65D3F
MKRFFIISALLLTLFVTSIACLFNLNDYSLWVAQQIEKSTGYQISFVAIEHNGWQDLRFSISGLSVQRGPEMQLEIDKINIEIARVDLWNRQLDFELVSLAGIDLHLSQSLSEDRAIDQKSREKTKYQTQNLPWDKLHIKKLRVSDLNLDLSNAQQSLLLQQATLSSDNLLVINNKKIVSRSFQGNVRFDFATLAIQLDDLKALTFDKLSLSGDLDLPNLQGMLALSIKEFIVSLPNQADIIVDNSLLDLQLDKNRLSLTRLFINIFSGELSLQADALLSLDLFPAPALSVERLQILSLLLKDMHLTIPDFMQKSEGALLGKGKLPIETLFLQQVNLQNVNIRSEEKQIPLTVKGLNSRVSDLYLLKNNQLASLSEAGNQVGVFVLQADYLQWADSIIEAFHVAGSLTESEQVIGQLLSENQALVTHKD